MRRGGRILVIYQLSSPLQADPERATATPPAGTQEQLLQGDLSSARGIKGGCSVHENMEAGPKMLRGEASGTRLQLGSGCPFGVGRAARPLFSSLIRGGTSCSSKVERSHE